jgi:4-amino-4-deoxy-L-arabinose transferase-like glycosyltransferase
MDVFFKAVDTQRPKYIYILAILLGIGCLTYQWMVLLAPVFLIFLIIQKEHRFWFKRKELYLAGLLAFMLVTPFLIWSYADRFSKLSSENLFDLGFSLRSFYLYFGEIFAWLTERTGFFIWGHENGGALARMGGKWHLWVDGSNEQPFIHWVLGVFIFIGYIHYAKQKNNRELIKFCLIMFTFVFLFTSVIAGADTLFDDHWWAEMTLFPGVILCSYMLVELQKKTRFINFVTVGLVTYSLVHAVSFINLPEHQYAVPREYLQKWYLEKAELYLKDHKRDLAIDRCRWVLARAKNEGIIKSADIIMSEAEQQRLSN